MVRFSKKCSIAIACVAMAVLLLVFSMILGERNHLKDGCEQGFRLEGMYTSVGTDYSSAAFSGEHADGALPGTAEGMRGEWQLVDQSGGHRDGWYCDTFDPNVFELYDEAGNCCGMAHLAFAMTDGDEGLLYVKLGDVEVGLGKVANQPAFVVG